MKTSFSVVIALFFLGFLPSVGVFCANELGDLLRQAQSSHPALVAQRAVVEQLLQRSEELREFLDPSLYGAFGTASQLRELPVSPAGYDAVGIHDSLEAQAGVLVPVEGGAYLSAGGTFRRWFHPDAGYERMYQHLVGVNLQIPLLRDRGFALYGFRRSAALAGFRAGMSRLVAAEQSVRREVECAYVAWCAAVANYDVRRQAVERFRHIYEETSELARLKTVPEYQVNTARRDLQTGYEDLEAAAQSRDAALVALASAVGVRSLPEQPSCDPAQFLKSAEELPESSVQPISEVLQRRGEYQAIQEDLSQAQSELSLEEESHKDQLALNAGVNWAGDSRHGAFASYRETTDHHWGAEAMIVWTRPLDYTGSSARIARGNARLAEIAARLDESAVGITAQVRTAQLRVESARKRLGFTREAAVAASATLAAEQERFRLGESTSTIVLDAQKELNAIYLRQNAAAAELLSANAELQYALGYPLVHSW